MNSSSLKNDVIRLVEYEPSHAPLLLNYFLSPDQLQFTSLPLEKLSSPLVSHTAKHIVILNVDTPVGYFALEDGEKLQKYSGNPTARLLTSFSIDSKYQGKGFAKTSLLILSMFIKNVFPEVSEIVLGVNQKNIRAYNLYIKSGFIDKGEILVGAKGPQNILHLAL